MAGTSPAMTVMGQKHSQMLAQIDAVAVELGRGRDHRDLPGVENHDVVGDVKNELGVLLHQHDRQAAFLQFPDRGHDLGDDLRRQALRRLVHQQHARVLHQRAADRQHLLLAAGQMRGDLVLSLGKPREHAEHGVDGPGRVPAAGVGLSRGHHQVFPHRQALEDAAALRDQRHAARRDLLRRQLCHRVAEHLDRAGARRQQPDGDVHAGRFARAVAAQAARAAGLRRAGTTPSAAHGCRHRRRRCRSRPAR